MWFLCFSWWLEIVTDRSTLKGRPSLNPNHRKREIFISLKDDNYQQEKKALKSPVLGVK